MRPDRRCYERCKACGCVSLNGGRHKVGAVGVFKEMLDPVAGCSIFLPRVEDDGVRVPSVTQRCLFGYYTIWNTLDFLRGSMTK